MVDLVIIYNHKYEANIPKLDHYYEGKFNKIWHLMPFYKGNAPHVIPVYDGSFLFQGFIAQAAGRLKQSDADHFLFIGDDLLLDPKINQDNVFEELGFEKDWGFISRLDDLSKGIYSRGVNEARTATLQHPGLEIGRELPTYDEALKLIGRHIKLESLMLRKYVHHPLKMVFPFWSNLGINWGRFKANIWHLRERARNWLNLKPMEYPLVGGYADLFSVPRKSFEQFAHYCGVFASAQIFVELALPTALAFSCEHIATEDTSPRRGLSVWFPPGTWEDYERKCELIHQIERQRQNSLANLTAKWPGEYFYMHPIKLSAWKN